MTPRHTFTAWSTSGQGSPAYLAGTASTLTDALALVTLVHKHTVMVMHEDHVTGTRNLHLFSVKQGKAEYRRNAAGDVVRMAKLYADPVAMVPVEAFDPVEAFAWSPGCDVVGAPKHRVINA